MTRPHGSKNRVIARTLQKQIRWTPAEWQRIEAAAEISGEPVCVWQRETLLERARIDGEPRK